MPMFYAEWYRLAKEEEEKQRKEGGSQRFAGFGRDETKDPESWAQFMDYILWLNEGAPDDDDEEPEDSHEE